MFSGLINRSRLKIMEGTSMELGKDRRVFVRLGFTDMRKQINGLAVIAQESRPEGPFDGSYFVFCGKTKRVVKILYWDATGFCLWQKRLENELFPWPRDGQELDEMTRQNIRLVLKGIDIWKEHKAVQYRIAG
jgi:transposase